MIATALDPDRFLAFPTPGAQEWWYFDAVSDDGRDALVVVWYAGLPFDPAYGVATLRHLRDPSRRPAPRALDHCAVGLSWYHRGETRAYALNAYREPDFEHHPDPFSIRVAGSLLERDADGYRLRVDTPAVDGTSTIVADLRFRPAPATRPLERDLGGEGSPHVWILAAPDCRVEGTVRLTGGRDRALEFRGRGYHDHNAGAEEISRAMHRWAWGRAHLGPTTLVYYDALSRSGERHALTVACRDGAPESVEEVPRLATSGRSRTVFGMPYDRHLSFQAAGRPVGVEPRHRVDAGPFYLRWVSEFRVGDGPDAVWGPGISEWLDTTSLNKPWFNWMIPYRLKRPGR